MLLAIKQYVVNFSDKDSTARSIAFWIAVALTLIFFVSLLAAKKDKRDKVKKIFAVIAGLYLAATIVVFALFKAQETEEDGGIDPLSLYPMLVFVILALATAVVFAVTKNKNVRRGFAGLTLIALELVVIFLIVYYITGIPQEKNYVANEDVKDVALWISAALIVAAIIGLSFTDRSKLEFNTRSITYAGILIALSFALSYVRVVKMPMGGSITLVSLLPIMLYSYMFGVRKGVIIGVIYGVLQAIQDPWILHPAQFLLDYPIAFAGIGLAGILKNTKLNPRLSFVLGGIIATMFRLLAHFLSGVFAFGSFASYYDMTSPYLYSIAYNATFVLPDAALAILVGALLMISKSFYKLVLNVDKDKKAKKKAA